MTRPGPAPRTSRRKATAVVASTVAAAGILVGALWAWLAPPVHGVVALTKAGDRVRAYLGAEADHFFVAAFLLLAMACAVALVAAVAAWQWRAHRGPVMLAGLCLGAVAGSALAAGVGAVLVRWRYGVIDVAAAPVSSEHRVHYVTEAPAVFFGHAPLHVAITLLIPAAVGAITYALLAMATARDDLGGYPPVEGVVLGRPATAPVTGADGGSAAP